MAETRQRASQDSGRVSVGARVVTLILLGLAVHLLLPQLAALERSAQVLRTMSPWLVGLAFAAQALSYLSSGYLLAALVRSTGDRLSLARGTMVFTAASTIGLIGGGPVGNVAATYRWLSRSGVSASGAALAGWVPTLFYNAALVGVGIFGLSHLLLGGQLSTLELVGFGFTLLVLLLGVALAVWGARHRPQLIGGVDRLARVWDRLRRRRHDPGGVAAGVGRVIEGWEMLRRGGWRGPAAAALLNTGFDMLTLYLFFAAAGHAVGLGLLLTGYGLPLLLGRISFLPGGVGVVEGTMAAVYASLGIPASVTVVVTLAYRLVSFWLPLVLGLPIIAYLDRRTPQPT